MTSGGGDPRRSAAGRGAGSNIAGRFESHAIVPFDDGWGTADEPPAPLRTTLRLELAQSILATNDSPDIPFDRSINPYRGCEHGCIYCFARPTHAYLGLSPGLDFESQLVGKENAAALLAETLSRPSYRCAPLALGSNTDPYQPVEREQRITRGVLQVLADFRHPVTIVTKSSLVLRDLDLLTCMAERRLVQVFVSVTTLDRGLARRLEPRAAAPQRRLETLRELHMAGVPVGVLASPIIPGLNDHELERILAAVQQAGAGSAGYLLVRLPHEVRPLFIDWLDRHYPGRKQKVLHRIQAMRGGQLNDPRFGSRMRGEGPEAALLHRRFEVACRRLGLCTDSKPLDTALFRVPPGCQPRGQARLAFD